ncbi:MAG: hypothetical protein COV47_03695 [Candidatus Diapherotrites archaeon CG11_big_fil_rev_8_21_14_0_20_37_9]|nr:MAG: hypothetical protein COV47_03695 [Candidatus Diapherotrites archaeon CG11_big_fil_rev_8_21_14_0_20_37_9]
MAADTTKSVIFLVLVIAVALFIFILIQNIDIITNNWGLVVFAIIVLYLIARYDYIVQLKDYERAVIFTFGKVTRVAGPGWTVIFPPIESASRVDLRTKTIDIARQDVVTKDNVEVTIDAVIYLKVNKDSASVVNSIVEVDDYVRAAELFVISTIRNKAGSLDLNALISQVDELNADLKKELERISKKWGVGVEEATIKDIQIPQTVLQAMHAQKAAVQEKLAQMERAKGQQAEIEAIKAAAENLGDKAISYYYIRALEKLGEGKSTKFILPLELTELAQSLSTRNLSKNDMATLFKEYEPMLKEFLKKAKK